MVDINIGAGQPENIKLPVDADAAVAVTPDGLEATIRLARPEDGGKELSYEMLKIFLLKNRIIYGIDEGTLRMLGGHPIYGTDLVVASGVRPVNGVDARIVYHIDTDRQLKPKEKEDGSVDFKDLGVIQEVKKGQLICEKIEAIPGEPGSDVKGTVLPYVPGRDVSLPTGQNTAVSEDKLKLYAGVDGHISVVGNRINVLNVFTVSGDVSVETGNIDFAGNVVVRGDVASGFSVRADGDVTVDGTVEAARVTAGGTLIIRGGFLGGGGGALNVSGNAVCKFIESGEVNVRGDLDTTYIMNANVRCDGTVHLTGKGLIRGGYVSARTSITANILGSPQSSSANTVIEIRGGTELSQHYEKLRADADETEIKIRSLKEVIAPMEKAKSTGYLTLAKFEELEKHHAKLQTLQREYESMGESLATLEGMLAKLKRGTVSVRKTAYTGLKIVIEDEMLILQNDHTRVSFYSGQEGIAFVPLMNE